MARKSWYPGIRYQDSLRLSHHVGARCEHRRNRDVSNGGVW
jgi:hypothetical protein